MTGLLIKDIPLPEERSFSIKVCPNGDCWVDDGGIIPIAADAVQISAWGNLIDENVLRKMLDDRISACFPKAEMAEKDRDFMRSIESLICGVLSDVPKVVEVPT